MKNKLLPLLILTSFLTTSLALPVFADDGTPINITSPETIEGNVTVDHRVNPDPNIGNDPAVTVTNTGNANHETVYHIADDPDTDPKEGNLTVNIENGQGNFPNGLSITGDDDGYTTAVIDNDVNMNIKTSAYNGLSRSEHTAVGASASGGSSASLIVGGDVNLTGDTSADIFPSANGKYTDNNCYGINLIAGESNDPNKSNAAGAVVFGDVRVNNPSSQRALGVMSDVQNGGSAYIQVNGNVTSNNTDLNSNSSNNNEAIGIWTHVNNYASSGVTIDEQVISTLRDQTLVQNTADGGLPANIDNIKIPDTTRLYVGGDVTATSDKTAVGVFLEPVKGIVVADIKGNVSASGRNMATGLMSGVDSGISDIIVGKNVSATSVDCAKGLSVYNQKGNLTNHVEVKGNVSATTTTTAVNTYASVGLDVCYGEPDNQSDTDIIIGGNIEAKNANRNATGILVKANYRTEPSNDLDIRVKKDVISDGKGIEIKDLGNSTVDIVVEGTITGNDDAAVITSDNGQDFTLSVWKTENVNDPDDYSILYDDSLKGNVQYIIKVDSPAVTLKANSETAWNNTKTLDNGEGEASTVYYVAKEDDRILLHIDKPAGKKIKKVYADADKTEEIKEVNGEYWLDVKRGGGILISVEFEDKAADPVDPVDPVDPIDPSDPADKPKQEREVKDMELTGLTGTTELTLEGKKTSITLYGPGKTISYNGRAHVWTEEKLNDKKKKKKVPDLDVSVNGIPGSVSFNFVYGKNKDASEKKAYLYLKLKPFKASPSYNALDPKVRKKLNKEIKKINKALKNKKNRFYFAIKPLDLSGFVLDSSKSTAGSLEFYRKGLKSDTLTLSVKQGKKGGESVFDEKTVKKAVLTANIAGYTFKIPKKQYTVKVSSGKVTVEGKGKNLEGVLQ